MNIPDNMRAILTLVWNNKETSEQAWENLIAMWYKQEWKGKYSKGKITIVIGYDEKMEKEIYREVRLEEMPKPKKKRKKRMKPAQKNKKKR